MSVFGLPQEKKVMDTLSTQRFKMLIFSAVVFLGNLVVVMLIEIQENKVSCIDRKKNFVNIYKLVTQKLLQLNVVNRRSTNRHQQVLHRAYDTGNNNVNNNHHQHHYHYHHHRHHRHHHRHHRLRRLLYSS